MNRAGSSLVADNSANAEISAALFVRQPNDFCKLCVVLSLHCLVSSASFQMMLKIERDSDGRKTIIRLCGRLQSEHVNELKTQLTDEPSAMILDLEGVTLVDVEVVGFLNACEESGVELLHCCPFIREWMLREQDRK
jgi:hypothetical protein